MSACSAAARIRSQLSRLWAIGFSRQTCLPAAKDCSAASSCRSWGSMMSTASKSPLANASGRDVNAGAPVRSDIAATLSGTVSTTAVTSIRGAWC